MSLTSPPPTEPAVRPDPPHRAERASSGRVVAAVLLPVRLFLAAGWLRAGIEKVIDPSWWSGEVLQAYLAEQRTHMLPFFGSFSDVFVQPLAVPTAWFVVGAQLAIGVGLLLDRTPRRVLWLGVVLNVCFTMAGSVNPSAFYLVMELAMLIGMSRPTNLTIAWRRATLWFVSALAVLPFARTIDPARSIDDPALMLAFVAGLAGVTTIAWSAAHLRFAVDWVDLLPRASWSEAANRWRRRLRSFTTAPRSG